MSHIKFDESYYYFSSDPLDVRRYQFITDYCGDDDELNVYESLTIKEIGHFAAFSIESFIFNDDSCAEIFMHCQVKT